MRRVASWVVAVAVLAGWPAVASAQGIAVARTGGEDQMALAGPQLLLPPARRAGGLLSAYPLAGGPPTAIGTTLVPASASPAYLQDFDASASTVAVIRTREDRHGGDLGSRVFAGDVGGPLRAIGRGAPGGRRGWPSLLSVSGRAVLVGVEGGTSDPLLSVHAPGLKPRRLPALPGSVQEAAIAGDLAAFAVHRSDATPDGPARVVLVNWRTGERLFERRLRAGVSDLDVAPDGRVVVSVAEQDRVLLFAPNGSSRVLFRDRRASVFYPRWAGSRIVAARQLDGPAPGAYVVTISPSTGHVRPISPRTEEVRVIDSDDSTVSWVANGCALATPVAGPRMRVVPPGPCFRDELSIRGRDTALRHRRAVADLYCQSSASGVCRGTLRLRLHRRSRAFAKRRFAIRGGRHAAIRLTVHRNTARRLRRGRSRDLLATTLLRDASGRRQRADGFITFRPR